MKSVRVDRNCAVSGSDVLLKWMLKSPVIAKCGREMAVERREVNSSRKVENGLELVEEFGGLYMLKMVRRRERLVRLMAMHSNELYCGRSKWVGASESLQRKATPPPKTELGAEECGVVWVCGRGMENS